MLNNMSLGFLIKKFTINSILNKSAVWIYVYTLKIKMVSKNTPQVELIVVSLGRQDGVQS